MHHDAVVALSENISIQTLTNGIYVKFVMVCKKY